MGRVGGWEEGKEKRRMKNLNVGERGGEVDKGMSEMKQLDRKTVKERQTHSLSFSLIATIDL